LYQQGKTALTPFKNDHVRFSLAVVISIMGCHYLWSYYSGMWRKIIPGAVIWLIVFLHVLAAKSGLLCFYLYLLILALRWMTHGKMRYGLLSLVLIVLMPIIAYFTSMTFRMKIQYLQYSLQQIKNENADTYISDEGRLISYRLALDIWNKNKILGVGAGDIKDEMDEAYRIKVKEDNSKVLLPHNQLLVFALVAGIMGVLVFLCFIVMPFFDLAFKRAGVFSAYAIMQVFPLMIEPMYEGQISITLLLFFLYFFRIIDHRSHGASGGWSVK
jgi:O-antigen ligase